MQVEQKEHLPTIRPSEIIKKYGTLRILVFCSENIGRSAILEWMMVEIIRGMIPNYPIEIISAGTNVEEKKSDEKYGGRTRPEVIEITTGYIGFHWIKPIEHTVKQLTPDMATKNTIAIALNGLQNIPSFVKKNCLFLLNYEQVDASSDDRESVVKVVKDYQPEFHYFAYIFALALEKAIEDDSFDSFQKFYNKLLVRG